MSVLITGGNSESRLAHAKELAKKAMVLEPSGIDEIRELEKLVSLGYSVIVTAAEKLTSEAQNAFLKTLEEPPENVTIILCAPNEDLLLPTVVSRCYLTDLGNLSDLEATSEDREILNWIKNKDFAKGSLWAEKIKDRGEAVGILDRLLLVKNYATTRALLKARKYLLANTNIRLTLENLFLK